MKSLIWVFFEKKSPTTCQIGFSTKNLKHGWFWLKFLYFLTTRQIRNQNFYNMLDFELESVKLSYFERTFVYKTTFCFILVHERVPTCNFVPFLKSRFPNKHFWKNLNWNLKRTMYIPSVWHFKTLKCVRFLNISFLTFRTSSWEFSKHVRFWIGKIELFLVRISKIGYYNYFEFRNVYLTLNSDFRF